MVALNLALIATELPQTENPIKAGGCSRLLELATNVMQKLSQHDIAEPAGFVEPCSLCESFEHSTRDHHEAARLRAAQEQAAVFKLVPTSLSSVTTAGLSPIESLRLSRSKASSSRDGSFSKSLRLQEQAKIAQPPVDRDSDFVSLYEVVVAGVRVVCGGTLKGMCGSVYVEGKHCFYCESFQHESSQCSLVSQPQASIAAVALEHAAVNDANITPARAATPQRVSFSKALAKQQQEQQQMEEEQRLKQQRIDEIDAEPIASVAATSVWIPKASNKGWRAYTKESDKQYTPHAFPQCFL